MGPVEKIVAEQREFFRRGTTRPVAHRREALKKLRGALARYEEEIMEALRLDLGKSPSESYMTELAMVYSEIKTALRGVNKWSRPQRKGQSLATFPSVNTVHSEPYGVVLIMAPWNYPFYLTLAPLVGAVAAGNCVVLKGSRNSPHSSGLIKRIVDETFGAEYIHCVDPDVAYEEVLAPRYDYILFTGSPGVGKKIMKVASENLTPVTLELGGKSPCFVDETADIALAAKRIAWGKFLNAGQTCISVDYVLVHRQVKGDFLEALKGEIEKNYPMDESFPKIINKKHFQRLKALMGTEEYWGGAVDEAANKIGPTIFPNSNFSREIMKEEIFGPILPIIEYDHLDEAMARVREGEKPLACYLFSRSGEHQKKILEGLSFGGGCINDVILHISNDKLPFGGVGNSGMGHYHGRYGFDTFSHQKAVVKSATFLDLPFRYKPFNDKKLALLRKLYGGK